MNSEIFDKSLWPCFTPDMFWALSDELRDIGESMKKSDDTYEYDIKFSELPNGEMGLWRVNALRDICLAIDEWPMQVRQRVLSATLCIGSKAIETVVCRGHSIVFKIFSEQAILPLFTLGDETLTIQVLFKDLEDIDPPRFAVHACGLLVRIKDRTRMPPPFFIAATQGAVLTWDGTQIVINQSAGSESWTKNRLPESIVDTDSETTAENSESIERIPDDSNFDTLWQALPLRASKSKHMFSRSETDD